ncbi:MAG: RHS repeat-associated core domain-containing protein, partial [Chloroflexi bacterium]|nr:RHS repeat-associated core domain-containing protein [Chloroflexota bacterium]MCI0643551.1 RHS repeat-associated core domain-containing protein [Chloroflexota bacterium]MCI0729641.1 RHS repeat-associated core domain-containing protein [Chloroflexota bacterium]
ANSSGAEVTDSRAYYLPFGGYRVDPTQTITDRGFTGHKHSDDLGLIYMKARWYLPGIGRFASADPIVPDYTNPQSFNRYSYVLNRSPVLTDPTGHRECDGSEDCSDPFPNQPPSQGGGIPDPIFDYPCTPSGNAVCITPEDDPIDMLTQVVYGEGGSISLQMAANVLQTLLNRAYNYWTCTECGYNPDQIPWEDITPEQLTALLLYIASQPYIGNDGNQYPAYNAWNSAYERGKGYWNDIREAIVNLINSAGQDPITVGGIAPYAAISGNRAVIYYGAGPMLAAPPGAVGYDEYMTPYYDGPYTDADRQLIVSIAWRQYYSTSAFDPALWVLPGYEVYWNIQYYWE